MRAFAIIAFALALVGPILLADRAYAAPRPLSPGLTPKYVESLIRRIGPRATIELLDKRDWGPMMDRIERGDTAWVRLVPELAPGSDGGDAEDLGMALAYGLPNNPHAVLSVIVIGQGHVIDVRRVCGLPFIEDDVKDRPAYKRRAIAAISVVHDPRLIDVKKACADQLTAAQ